LALEVRIQELRISSGTAIPVPETGVVAIVGPNNTGKSAGLRETLEHLTGTPPPPERPRRVVVDIRVHKEGDEDDLREWLETHCRARTERSTRVRSYRRPNAGPIGWDPAVHEWQNIPVFGPTLTSFFTLSATAEARLGLVGSSGLWDPWTDVPSNPLQMLFADPELERRLSELAQQAFGTPLTLSRVPGGAINLHVGTSEVEPGIVPTEAYLDALRALPLVMEQGDGMKSFIGIMLALVAAFYPVVMIDEPEAFLHPPQARLLGQRLAREASGRSQVIVATHSTDLLLGLLDAPDADVTIVRMTRRDDVNPVAILPHDQLEHPRRALSSRRNAVRGRH
jgi:hypothetical protein